MGSVPDKMMEKVICMPRFTWVSSTSTFVKPKNLNIYELMTHIKKLSEVKTRGVAENDESSVHLCTYVLVFDKATGKILTYRRAKSGTESRLHDLRSCGFGGHINAETDFYVEALRRDNNYDVGRLWFISAARREVAEELPAGVHVGIPQYIGLVAENGTPVGRVHAGLVFRLDAELGDELENSLVSCEEDQADLRLENVGDIDTSNMEEWSKICIEHLKNKEI